MDNNKVAFIACALTEKDMFTFRRCMLDIQVRTSLERNDFCASLLYAVVSWFAAIVHMIVGGHRRYIEALSAGGDCIVGRISTGVIMKG